MNGTLSGSAAFVTGGISGNAISISPSTNGLVNIGNNFGALPVGSFSMMAWVKTTTASPAIPISKHNGGTLNGFLLAVNDINASGGGLGAQNKATAYVSSDDNPAVPISSTTVNDNQWHQILGTYSPGGSLTLYVDGVLQDSKTAQTYNPNTSSFIVGGIGQSNSDGTPVNAYNGLIDDVQLYNTALTASDAAYLFAHPGQELPVPEPSMVGMLVGLAWLGINRRRR